MKNIGFQKVHKFNTAIQVSTTFVTDKATATSWATSTNTTSAVTTSTTATSNYTTQWYTATNTTTTWQTSSSIPFNTTSNWTTVFETSTDWSTSSTIQTLKSTSSSFNTSASGSTTWTTIVALSAAESRSTSTSYYASTSYYVSTGYYASTYKTHNTLKSHTTNWTVSTLKSGSATTSYYESTSVSQSTSYYANTTYSRTTCSGGGFGGGQFCLPTGTQINISTTETKSIEDLVVGDTIMSKGGGFNTDDFQEMHDYDVANMTGHLRETTITAHFSTESDDNINFNNGLLIATNKHYHIMKVDGRWAVRPIYVAKLYLEAGKPVFFYNIDGTEVEITSAETDTTNIQVWEIDTEPDDVYFASGLLTHNHKRKN